MTEVNRTRVSTLERLVPFIGFMLATLGGGIASFLLFSFHGNRPTEAADGVRQLGQMLLTANSICLALLYTAIIFVFAGIIMSGVRMFTNNSTASPLGVANLLFGIASLVPAALFLYASDLLIVIFDPAEGISYRGHASAARSFAIASMIAAAVIIIPLLAWPLIPFKSQPGRRFGPIIALIPSALTLIAIAVYFQVRVLELLGYTKNY